MKNLIRLLLILAACCAIPVRAQVINAASCSQTDVQTAFNSIVASTTTVNIPAGTCNWTGQVTLSQPSGSTTLSILGAGSLTTTGGGDVTVFVDNSTSNASLLEVTSSSTSTAKLRIAGITFEGGTGAVKFNGFIEVGGSSQNIRFDHMHLDPATYSTVTETAGTRWGGCTAGVVDHIIWDAASVQVNNAVQNYNDATCFGETDGLGHASWANPTNPGTAATYMYVESSVFNNGASNDCLQGGRFVSRFNTYNVNGPAPTIQTHPTGSDGGFRGCRAQEVYENTMNAASGSYLNANVWINSGTALVWGNTVPSSSSGGGTGFKNFIELLSTRQNNNTYPQIATPDGWGYCGTAFNGTGSNWDENSVTSSGYHCMDQAGRGQGDLLTGGFTSDGSGTNNVTNTATGCVSTASCAYPRQANEPIYEWMDAYSAVPSNPSNVVDISSEPTAYTVNTDYYMWCDSSRSGFTSPQNCTSFTGATGTGSGVLASRPSTCTTGVLYWATDQGSWNQSGSGPQGVAYKCTATNTWTLFYTPLTFPHPLVSGSTSVATPTASPGAGTYTSPQTIALSTATPGAIIGYTTDGSTPTATTPGTVDHGTTIYVNVQNNSADWMPCSGTTCAGGTNTGSFPTPTFGNTTPIGTTTIEQTCNGNGFNCLLFQHLGCPGGSCTAVTGMTEDEDFYIPSASNHLQALEFDPDLYDGSFEYFASMQCDSASGLWRFWNSAIGDWTVLNSSGGTITTYACTVLTSTNTNHHFHLEIVFNTSAHTYTYNKFTIDGTTVFSGLGNTYSAIAFTGTPTVNIEQQIDNNSSATANTIYYDNITLAMTATPLVVSTSQTIKAIGTLSGDINSSVLSAAYTIAPLVATPTASPVAGTYGSTQSVTLSTSTGGATICYTTSGATPSATTAGTCDVGSTTYTGVITVSSSQTIKAIGTLSGDTNSSVLSAAYVITTPGASALSGGAKLSGGAVLH